MAIFAAMPDVMRLRVIGHGPHGRVRHVEIPLPLITALLEDAGRYFLPGQIAPADADEPSGVIRRRRGEAERRRRARAFRDLEETRALKAAAEWIRKRRSAPRSRVWSSPGPSPARLVRHLGMLAFAVPSVVKWSSACENGVTAKAGGPEARGFAVARPIHIVGNQKGEPPQAAALRRLHVHFRAL